VKKKIEKKGGGGEGGSGKEGRRHNAGVIGSRRIELTQRYCKNG
jgi:hypothetical protein